MASATSSHVQTEIYSCGRKGTPDLRLLHYNDVYHIEAGSAEPVGGIARFQTVVNEYQSHPKYLDQPSLITLFSGDAFNPSLESSVTKGTHMIPFLNALGTDVACVGNHDLDFGIAQFRHLREQCEFPWLLANVLDPALGEGAALANCDKTDVLTSSNGIKIGVVGLAEREWLGTINSLPPNLIYRSASATANELVPALRAQGCELIIALTHMREPNDIKLAEKTNGLLDFCLGGHDHYFSHQIINSTHVLRSGTDFKQLSYIEGWRREGGGWDFSITRRDIVRATPEYGPSAKLVNELTSKLKNKLDQPVGYTATALDAHFTTVRTRESNLGNFVCDLMRFYYNADCALMAGGTIRGDQIYPPGVLRLKDIMNCFPFEDPVVVLRILGQAIWEALENSVCLVPALEGRYPQVSNIIFEYDPERSPGSRVKWVKIHDEPLERSKMYTIATRGYMGRGKDGFDSLLVESEGGQAEELVSEENGVLISTILRQYFLSLKVMGRWRRWSSDLHRHWEDVHSKLHQNGRIKDPKSQDGASADGNETSPAEGEDAEPVAQTSAVDSEREPTRPHANVAEPARRHKRVPRDVGDHHLDGAKLMDSDSEDSDAHEDSSASRIAAHPLKRIHTVTLSVSVDESDYLYELARSAAKKWMRLAGIKREHVGTVGEVEDHFIPDWTRGIAPKEEGRIIITKSKPAKGEPPQDDQV